MNKNKTLGSRPIFSEDEQIQFVYRTARTIQDVWPELGAPQQRDIQDASVLIFSQRENVEVRVKWSDKGRVHVGLQITPTQPSLAIQSFAELLRKLGGRWVWLSGEHHDPPGIRIFSDLDSGSGGLLYEAVFVEHLRELKQLCESLCPVRQKGFNEATLRAAYIPFDKTVELMVPWQKNNVLLPDHLSDWTEDVYGLLQSGFPVAVAGEIPLERQLALTLLAERCIEGNKSLGRLTLPGIAPDRLMALIRDVPGFLVAPARTLEMNTNPYERGEAVKNLLRTLLDEHLPCVFEGAYSELQVTFRGGQGAKHDPLNPAVCRVPEIPMEILTHYAFWFTARRLQISLPINMSATVTDICTTLACYPSAERRLLGSVVEHVLRQPGKGICSVKDYVSGLSQHTETFGAIGVNRKLMRSPEVQNRFQSRLTSHEFLKFLKTRLFGQEEALDRYAEKLQEEILTRPLYQPLVMALQGTPGTGKSECLALTAEWLGVPHIVIDAASIPDAYIGVAQLLGSGRGIVGSYEAGRLEQVAAYHLGAVIEVADIDHAVPAVRSSLGDIFLQIMQTGEAQSSIGAMFSCANLFLAFSLNLPGGKDEKAYQRVGFGNAPTLDDIRRDVQKEIKNMISGAFLSRLGEPVLFSPLSREAQTKIIHAALSSALKTGMERTGMKHVPVEIAAEAVTGLVNSLDSSTMTFGARGLVDMARSRATTALIAWREKGITEIPHGLRFVGNDFGEFKLICNKPASNEVQVSG